MKKVLAIDMGATSIRGILGFIKDGKLELKEVMRAKHTMSEKGERLRWDMPLFISNIEKAILEKYIAEGKTGVNAGEGFYKYNK